MTNVSSKERLNLLSGLNAALGALAAHPYPFVAGPESMKKRASVALIIRVQPHYEHWPEKDERVANSVDDFFEQDWVRHGDPEVLFIKRAARKGDRWTSHIALPGGRRDPEDEDDLAAAIRETREEVGLDLMEDALSVGNLPQRVVTTHWGKVPLMVLCPYVFLVTRHKTPPLRLQPTEVASTHWVPLTALLSSGQRGVILEDVSRRLANQETGVRRWMLRAMVGKMVFASIHLLPSESLHCTASPAESSSTVEASWSTKVLHPSGTRPAAHESPLMLWGLTLGVLADFLDLLPPHTALSLWTYPTFTPWDVRFAIWALSYRFRQKKAREIQLIQESRAPPTVVEEGRDGVSMPQQGRVREAGIHGLSTGTDQAFFRTELKSSAVGTMLEGYYDIVRKAVAVALIGRASAALLLIAWLVIKARRARAAT